MIPKDPVMLKLRKYTVLRDFYRSSMPSVRTDLTGKELEDKLDMIDYAYDPAVWISL